MIKEISLLRGLSCLFIVLVHCIEQAEGDYANMGSQGQGMTSLVFLKLLLKVGTGIFVFISEFILAYKYPDKLPEGFFAKRARFLLIPFAVMAVFYAAFRILIVEGSSPVEFLKQIVLNVFFGGFHGYFIIIIFQFYLLHALFVRYAARIKMAYMLTGALLVNLAYLGFFNFVSPPSIPRADYIWYNVSTLPLFGWLFYFVLAYYCGTRFEAFKRVLAKGRYLIVSVTMVTAAACIAAERAQLFPVNTSKRIDVFLLTCCTALLLFSIGLLLKRVPAWLTQVSNYSFGIYWLHFVFIALASFALRSFMPMSGYLYVGILLIISTALAMAATELLQRIPYGVYAVGRVRDRAERSRSGRLPAQGTHRLS
ncbi:acyltransferase family protein [Cohnella sp. JJ-181]|uniref:acyltransferase family protein n=1 Tax=Cohnella rhizoplanae TaxID=2974897 RepID=UPI0022FF7F45|nr:acyltransferase family protein [Cohnella sp. JJ-181]CAI6076743.1 hypothetical protein COHCIP112018_02541 [Cohnella sp. JJ-181]